MIAECLKPLLFRMKTSPIKRLLSRSKNQATKLIFNNPPLKDLFWEEERHKEIAPTAILLIEQGIGKGLVRRFKQEGEVNQELLEQFVLQAAMAILVPTKEERKAHWEEWVNKSFEEIIYDKLFEIRKICKYIHKSKDSQITKQTIKVKEELIKLRDIYLSAINPPKKPDMISMLNNLFLKYLPGVEKTFIDTQIRKMVKPFGNELEEGAVRQKNWRDKDEWFTWKGDYFKPRKD